MEQHANLDPLSAEELEDELIALRQLANIVSEDVYTNIFLIDNLLLLLNETRLIDGRAFISILQQRAETIQSDMISDRTRRTLMARLDGLQQLISGLTDVPPIEH